MSQGDSHADRITGPPPLNPSPDRQGWPVDALLGEAKLDGHDQGGDGAALRTIAQLVARAPTGREALGWLRTHDVWIATLSPSDPSYGYLLSSERVIHMRTGSPWQAARTLVHEARHADQMARGFSTLVEAYEPGTRLAHDGAGYLLLNRAMEADADAVSVQVARELRDAVDAAAWSDLCRNAEFGRLAAAYDRPRKKGARVRMAAAFDEWFRMGRAYGYDVYLLTWLEKLAERHGPIRAARPFDHDSVVALTAGGSHGEYVNHARTTRLDRDMYAGMAEDVQRRVDALDIRLG